MITNQEYNEIVQGLGNEIAYNLADTVAVNKIILLQDLEREVEVYYMEQEEISYSDLEYETIQVLQIEGYKIVNKTEYAIIMGKKIAEEIHRTTDTHRTSKTQIEKELEYHEYPDDIYEGDIIDEAINALLNLDYIITDTDELIRPFDYHCTPNVILKPYDEDKNKNIKGLELEISDNNYKIEETLAKLANKHIIATPDNWNNSSDKISNIALEEDGSVKYELIFRAQTNNKIMEELEKLRKLETIVDNHSGTSAHIHINRKYIEEELGLTQIDIVKSAEFIYYPLFLISGRIKQTAQEWARSQLCCRMKANLAEKAKHVDRLTSVRYSKYNFVNCDSEDTIEFRIFSNKCNFNKNVINMYLKTVDFIIELASYMKNKRYNEELQNIIPLCKNHFKKFEDTLNFFNTEEEIMNEFKEPKELLKITIKNEWISIDNNISEFMHYTRTEPNTYKTKIRFISMVKILNREYEFNYNFNFNPEKTNVQKLASKIRREIREKYEIKMEAI